MKLIGYLLLTLALLCQGAVARVHIGAEMTVDNTASVAAATMDCHGGGEPSPLPVQPKHVETMPCHDDIGCDGECGQCQIVTAAAAILPLLPILPEFHSVRADAALPEFNSITLFSDSPPPSV